MQTIRRGTFLPLAICALVLAGCSQYIKRDEFNATVSELRGADADITAQMDDMRDLFGELAGQLNRKFEGYDAQIASVQGRLRVEMTAHFAFDDASLREEDKPALTQFADVIVEHHPNVIVTVEGFTDTAGDPEYNKWLGLQRANAVREYLVGTGGMNATRVRAVSYGEDPQRLIRDAWGERGSPNRRVALVIDYIGE